MKTVLYLMKVFIVFCNSIKERKCELWNKKKKYNKIETDSACGYWESNEQAEEEPENDVQVALFKIAKRVEELAIILKKE